VEIVDVLGRIVNVVSDMPYATGHQSIQTSVAIACKQFKMGLLKVIFL